MFANCLLHEVGGHLFITFLNNGALVAQTPPHITSDVVGRYSDEHHGESGRRLECILFGGNLEFYKDRNQDDAQVSPSKVMSNKEWANKR